MFIIIILIFI